MITVILTRPTSHIDQAIQSYREAGLQVLSAPCFEVQTNHSIQADWFQVPADIWVVLSVPALQHALKLAPNWQPDSHTHVIAVGPAVEQAWRQIFNHPITSHPSMNSEGVVELLGQQQPNSINILTTADGRNVIKSYCMQQGISYCQINTYIRKPLPIDMTGLLSQLVQDTIGVLTATSVGILLHLMSQTSQALKPRLLSLPLVVGSKRIAREAQKLGFADVHTAQGPSDELMCKAVKAVINDGND